MLATRPARLESDRNQIHKDYYHMITIQAQVAPQQRQQIVQAIIAQYPALDGKIQAITASGVFRLVGVRGGSLPVELTAATVEEMITTTQTPDLRGGNFWSGKADRRIRRNR